MFDTTLAANIDAIFAPQGHWGINAILLLLGMALIVKGGDWFTDSAVAIARATRVPPAIIGATIVSMATTFPEFMVSFTSVWQGSTDLAVGNALGSCCCNIGLIVGVCALISGMTARRHGSSPGIPVARQTLLRAGGFMLTAGVSVYFFSMWRGPAHEIDRVEAGLLLVLLVAYLSYSLRSAWLARLETEIIEQEEHEADVIEGTSFMAQLWWFFIGGIAVVIGSKFLVGNAVILAKAMAVPQLIIGLTILAIGTSLPEFTISLMAVIKGHGALGIGNIIGANVLNICWVIASCALVNPLKIQPQTIILDGPVMLGFMILMIALGFRHERISRRAGGILFTLYIAYFIVMIACF